MKTREPDAVERFIALIREIDPVYMVDLFANGGCFQLYRIVKVAFPSAEAWWTPHPGHVWIKVGRYWYDIHERRARMPRKAERIAAEDPGEHQQWLSARLLCQYHGRRYGSHIWCEDGEHAMPSLAATETTGARTSEAGRQPHPARIPR